MDMHSSTGGGYCSVSANAADSGAAANAKRKLEHSATPAAQTMKIPRDTTQQRRRSSAVVPTDAFEMKCAFSDRTMYDKSSDVASPASPTSDDDDNDDAMSSTQTRIDDDRISQQQHQQQSTSSHTSSNSSSSCSRPSEPMTHHALDKAAPPPRTASFSTHHHAQPAALVIDMDLDMPSTFRSSGRSRRHSMQAPVASPFPFGMASTSKPDADKTTASVPKRSMSLSWPSQAKKTRNPGNLSLDLSQMEHSPLHSIGTTTDGTSTGDSYSNGTTTTTTTMRRNDSAATCSRITDFLFVGGAAAAKDRDALVQAGITHILNCAASVAPDFYPQDFQYLNLRLRDHASQDIARHFYSVFDFIETARQRGGRVFVHCVKGISRSPTIAMAYLMWYKRIGMYKALDLMRQARPVVDPNAGFIFQLTEWEHLHRMGSLQIERTVVFRVEVPRDSNDKAVPTTGNESMSSSDDHDSANTRKPLLIGPLTAINEETFHNPSHETSKLSFIVTCADSMVVWCGADASEAQVEASQHATSLLQAFEAFPDKYEIVFHGQESSSFWNLVGALRPDDS